MYYNFCMLEEIIVQTYFFEALIIDTIMYLGVMYRKATQRLKDDLEDNIMWYKLKCLHDKAYMP